MNVKRATIRFIDIERKYALAYDKNETKFYCSFFGLRAVALGSAGPYLEQVNRLAPETPKRGDEIIFTLDPENTTRVRKWASAVDWDGAEVAHAHEQELERERMASAAIKKFGRGINTGPVAPPRAVRQPREDNFYLKRLRETQQTEA